MHFVPISSTLIKKKCLLGYVFSFILNIFFFAKNLNKLNALFPCICQKTPSILISRNKDFCRSYIFFMDLSRSPISLLLRYLLDTKFKLLT